MKILLNAEKATGEWTAFSVHMGNIHCGVLDMRQSDALFFKTLISRSPGFMADLGMMVEISGVWFNPLTLTPEDAGRYDLIEQRRDAITKQRAIIERAIAVRRQEIEEFFAQLEKLCY